MRQRALPCLRPAPRGLLHRPDIAVLGFSHAALSGVPAGRQAQMQMPIHRADRAAPHVARSAAARPGGALMHPQTQGKIERWHQTLKNRILLENYFLPGDLETQIEAFVVHYNHQRYHETLNNVTPADAYFGRASAIIQQREWIKRQTIELRRLQHRKLAA